MRYYSTKTFTHSTGLSCCFRQWRAESHCRFLHGYALEVRIEFTAKELDYHNWVFDFGSCKPIKQFLERTFDHKTIMALDDPMIEHFRQMQKDGLIQLVGLPSTGCEAFAEVIFNWTAKFINEVYGERVVVASVEVKEHAGNSAIVKADAY
jgi:6-pyruvoyltetrahydropterin/6-carboxytetrahydropterin synthase